MRKNSQRFHVVIPCAGTGSRSGMSSPKQYAQIAGKPMVAHTLSVFNALPSLGHGVVIVSPDDHEMEKILSSYPLENFQIFNTGGKTRAESVLAGLAALKELGIADSDWILVHDAARCLITLDLVDKLVSSCKDDEVGGLLALPLPDTLKSESLGRVSGTISRNDKWLAQTPQMFRWHLLVNALKESGAEATDESSAVEAFGKRPLLIQGAAFNFKVTYPEDMLIAEAILFSRQEKKVDS